MKKRFVKQIAAAGLALLLGMPAGSFPFVYGEEGTASSSEAMFSEEEITTEEETDVSLEETYCTEYESFAEETDPYDAFIEACISEGWSEADARETAELAAVQGIGAAQLLLMSGSALLMSGNGESDKLPYTAEEFLSEAAARLGASYIWGGKGAGYCVTCPDPLKTAPGTHPVCYANGYDCSGFVYDTMSHFGITGDASASVSGPSGLPLSASGWIAGKGNPGYVNIAYQGYSGHLEHVGVFDLGQFQTGLSENRFMPGDVIVEYDAAGSAASHVFFYFGDFSTRAEVVSYLTNTLGVPADAAEAYTVDEGPAWAGGTHWRIEAHGSQTLQGAQNGYFVRVNNGFEGKGASALFEVWRQPVTVPEEPEETGWLVIEKQDADDEQKKLSGIIFEIYTDEAKSEGSLAAVVTTDENGLTQAVELPLGTYYIWEKDETVKEGYMIPTQAWAVALSEQGSSVSIKLTNQQKPGKISLQKTDENGNGIEGITFAVYTDEQCQNPAFACVSETDVTLTEQSVQIITGEGGYGESTCWLKAGQYYVKEVSGKDGYWKGESVYPVWTGNGVTTALETPIVNERVKGQIKICKKGEVLSGYQDGAFIYSMEPKSGVSFEITAAEDIILPDQTEPFYVKGEVIETVVSGEDGYALSQPLPLGMYQVKETGSSEGLLIHHGEGGDYTQTVVLIQPQEYTETYMEETGVFENYYSDAQIVVYKMDAEGSQYLEGALFGLFAVNDITANDGTILVPAGTCLENGRTDSNGYLKFQTDIPYGEYEVRELEPRTGYAGTSEGRTISFYGGKQAVYHFENVFYNTMLTGALKIIKVDEETTAAQPPATLQGAGFGLYAAEDIVHPDGKSGLLFAKDTPVTDVYGNPVVMITDSNGCCQADGLYPGNYYIREIKPSQGYLLNQNAYPVTVTAGSTEQAAVVQVPETLIMGKIAIRKYSKAEGHEEMPVLAGAVFCVYPMASLCYLEDGSVDYENSPRIAVSEDGNTEMVTGENGEAVSCHIPYGSYLVHEVKAPENHICTQDFEVVINEEQTIKNEAGIPVSNGIEAAMWMVVTNQQFTIRLTVVKKDAESKRVIEKPAGFKLYSEAADSYLPMGEDGTEIFYTDGTGMIRLQQPLTPGEYWLEEVQAPEGYCCLNQKLHFTVAEGMVVERTEDSELTHCYEKVLTVEDIPVKGRIEIYKEGEVLTGFDVDTGFVYGVHPMEGAVFAVIADEDIAAPEYKDKLYEKGNVVYRKDTEIASVTTGEDGIAVLEGLPLGRYRIEERTAPYGLLKSGQVHTAVLEWKDQMTRIVADTDGEANHFVNDRPVLDLLIHKTGEHEAEVKPLHGAGFGLYNRFDIVDYKGNLLVAANTRLAVAVSDLQGKAVFGCDIPSDVYMPEFDREGKLSMYYVLEEIIPDGYSAQKDPIEGINLIWDMNLPSGILKKEIEVVNTYIQEEGTSEEDISEAETEPETESEETEEEITQAVTEEETTEAETEPEKDSTTETEPDVLSQPIILGIEDFSGYAGAVLIIAGCLLLCTALLWKIRCQKR